MREDRNEPSSPGTRAVTRRFILLTGATGAGGLTTLAGCLDDDAEPAAATGGESTPTGTPTATPEEDTPSGSANGDGNDDESASSEEDEADDSEDETADGEWFIRPDGSPRTTPPQLVCDEEHEGRFPQRFSEAELQWGDDTEGHWELRIDTVSATYGDTITVRLRNVSGEDSSRTSKSDFNIQVRTEVGWQDVRVKEHESDAGTHDAMEPAPAGEGPEWELTMTEDAVAEAHEGGRGTVCPGLPSGRYRFVFAGTETEPVGVAFDFTD